MSVRQQYQSLENANLDLATPEKMHQTAVSFNTRGTVETKGGTTEARGLDSVQTMPTPHQAYADTHDSQE